MFVVLMGALHLMTLSAAIGYEFIKVDNGVKLIIAVLFTVIGNLMPKFKHNYFIGIKTPWTLASEEVWFATHRLGGKLWFYGGLIMIIFSFIPGAVVSGIIFCGNSGKFNLYAAIFLFGFQKIGKSGLSKYFFLVRQ